MKKYDPNSNGHLIAQVKDRLRNDHGFTVEVGPYSKVNSATKPWTVTHSTALHIYDAGEDVIGECLLPRDRKDLICWILEECEKSLKAGDGLPDLITLRKRGELIAPNALLSDAPGTVYH